jgi:hypothetical protein
MTPRSAPAVAVDAAAAPTAVPEFLPAAVEAAMAAPSIHITQPWRFRPPGNQTGGLVELYAGRSRSLTVLAPTGRQLEMLLP